MNEETRVLWQLLGALGGVGFVIIMGFSQLGDNLIDGKPRHFVAAAAWFLLAPVLALQAAGLRKPPLLDPQLIADGMAVGWAIAVMLGMVWGVLRQIEKRRETIARRSVVASAIGAAVPAPMAGQAAVPASSVAPSTVRTGAGQADGHRELGLEIEIEPERKVEP